MVNLLWHTVREPNKTNQRDIEERKTKEVNNKQLLHMKHFNPFSESFNNFSYFYSFFFPLWLKGTGTVFLFPCLLPPLFLPKYLPLRMRCWWGILLEFVNILYPPWIYGIQATQLSQAYTNPKQSSNMPKLFTIQFSIK